MAAELAMPDLPAADLDKLVPVIEKLAAAVILELSEQVGPEEVGFVVGVITWEILEDVLISAITAGGAAAVVLTAKLPNALRKIVRRFRLIDKTSGVGKIIDTLSELLEKNRKIGKSGSLDDLIEEIDRAVDAAIDASKGARRTSGRQILDKVGLTDDIRLKLPPDQAGHGLRKFRHSVEGGKLRRQFSSGQKLGNFRGQRVDFVITKDGRLVIGRGHSVLSDGAENVRFAGELKFNSNGDLVEITNRSGHYQPPSGQGLTGKSMKFLDRIGVDVSKAKVIEVPVLP